MIVTLVFLSATLTLTYVTSNECNTREVEFGIVCVCNSTFCDTIPELEDLPYGKYQILSTSKVKLGHNHQVGTFSRNRYDSSNLIKVGKRRYQKIIGFGGAFTDSTGRNIRSLPGGAQDKLLESYFGKSGIEYSLCRVPIGGTDFSPKPYSYDDYAGDETLEHFRLQKEDVINKIPLITQAKKLRHNSNFKLYASAWTAPPWMKTNNTWTGYSMLKDKYYQLWADYAVKFLDEYKKQNIEFWGITTGNEPQNGFFSYEQSKINAMGWIPGLQAKWISQNLGPTLDNSSYGDIKIIIGDDSRVSVPFVVPTMYSDENAMKYIDGVGVHWYNDNKVPAEVLKLLRYDKKEIFRLMSEACYFLSGVELGSWDRAAGYLGSIIEYLENGFGGWVDWNMALNLSGGPTYINYEADSPILVNASAKEFYKQPMFYAMGHFSKYVVPDSVRLDVDYGRLKQDEVKAVAFLRPDNLVALVLLNNGTNPVTVQVQNEDLYSDSLDLVGNSVSTVLFSLNDA